MSKFGDDLIRSLKEAVAHAKGRGSGIEHTPQSARGPDARDSQAEATDAEEAD